MLLVLGRRFCNQLLATSCLHATFAAVMSDRGCSTQHVVIACQLGQGNLHVAQLHVGLSRAMQYDRV